MNEAAHECRSAFTLKEQRNGAREGWEGRLGERRQAETPSTCEMVGKEKSKDRVEIGH